MFLIKIRMAGRALIIFFLVISSPFFSQKKILKEIIEVNGYIKYLPSLTFFNSSHTLDHLLHNRFNVNGYLTNSLSVKLGVRNRIFFGKTVSTFPSYGDLIDQDNGELDLSFLIVDNRDLVFHSIVDRAFIDFESGSWEVRAGRQRINWGINLVWNTNDLFNAYNFVDFDYQERPGTDALRIQYYSKSNLNLDIAYKPGNGLDNTVLGYRLGFNKYNYDFQFLVANYYNDIVFGGGWAGNLKNAGFKGEVSYFVAKDNITEETSVINLSSSVDYSLKKGVYLNTSFLFNSNGSNSPDSLVSFGAGSLTAKNLMPSKYSYFAQVSGSLTHRMSGSFSVIYGQGLNILFLMPSIGYALGKNLDLSLTTQFLLSKEQRGVNNQSTSLFVRVWYSF